MYKVFMVLNENGEQIPCSFKDSIVQVVKLVLNECLVLLDMATKCSISLEDKVIGVFADRGFLVVKNEKSTFCFVQI